MNHEDAFVQSIVHDPDDDAPRLIFADWLDENGDEPRARFIRTQCRLAKLGEHDPERLRLQAEEAELLPDMQRRLTDRKHPRWAGNLARWVKEQRPAYERGFVTRLGTTPTRFLDHAGPLMGVAPIAHLTLNNVLARLDDLLAWPLLPRIRSLVMTHQRLGDGAIAAIVGTPGVAGLTNLDLLRNRFRIDGAIALANSPHLNKLERLALNVNRIHDRGPEALAASPHMTNLKRLELADCQIGPRGAAALARSSSFGQLQWLALRGNRLADAGAQALASATGLGAVADLDVRHNQMGTAGVGALLQNTGLTSLRFLEIDVQASDSTLWRAAPAAHLRGRLELRAHTSSDPRPADLAESPLLAACAGLALVGGRRGDATARAIADTAASRGLRMLEMVGCGVGVEGARSLLHSPNLPALRKLSLAQNRLTKEAIEAILAAPLTRQLTHLDLTSWGLTDEMLSLIGKAASLEQIACLRLGRVWQSKAEQPLRERFGWRVVFE